MIYAGNFSDGYVFTSEAVFKHQGAFSCTPQRPEICDKCLSRSVFHAHGRYQRGLTTLRGGSPASVRVWRHRWLCLCCGRTMSNGTPDVLAHSTGHGSRLARKEVVEATFFGDPDDSKEELTAEMAAAYLCFEAGISPQTLENSAAYIKGWLKVFNDDRKLLVCAAAAAQKAADFILDVRFED